MGASSGSNLKGWLIPDPTTELLLKTSSVQPSAGPYSTLLPSSASESPLVKEGGILEEGGLHRESVPHSAGATTFSYNHPDTQQHRPHSGG